MSISYRLMTQDDVELVDQVWRAALMPLMVTAAIPPSPRTEREKLTDLARFRHVVSTDPEGVFVATDNARIVGICQSSRRGTTFVLSRLGVAPDHQERAIGRELFSMARSYASDADEQFIFTSRDPRAIHSYVREGFALHPCINLVGRAFDIGTASSVRPGSSQDLDFVDAVDQAKRGISRRIDLQFWFDRETNVLIDEDGGYLLFDDKRLLSLCAITEDIAERLLSTALNGAFGLPPIEANWIVREQKWALRSAIQSRASISIHGAIMTRNVEHFVVPYLPNASLG